MARMKLTTLVRLAAVMLLPVVHVSASDAFFSPDGKTVTALLMHGDVLANINVATGKVTPIPLSKPLEEQGVNSIARGADGEILALTDKAVWFIKTGEAPKQIASTAPIESPRALFVDTKPGSPTLDWLFISGYEKQNASPQTLPAAPSASLYARKPGGKGFVELFCRRTDDPRAGVFSADGRLFIAAGMDLWEGSIQTNDDADAPTIGTLVGARIAALGVLNTDDSNGGSMSVERIATAGRWIYCVLRGHHMAGIVRIPMAAQPLYSGTGQEQPTIKQTYAVNAATLSKAEVIADGIEHADGFCATEVGGKPLVFYTEDRQLMLWTGSGEPRSIGREAAN